MKRKKLILVTSSLVVLIGLPLVLVTWTAHAAPPVKRFFDDSYTGTVNGQFLNGGIPNEHAMFQIGPAGFTSGGAEQIQLTLLAAGGVFDGETKLCTVTPPPCTAAGAAHSPFPCIACPSPINAAL